MIANRDELAARVDRYLVNSTITVAIPDLISVAEAWLRRKLKIDQTEVTATVPVVDGVAALPADCGGVIGFVLPGSTWPALEQVTIENLRDRPVSSGQAMVYAIHERAIRFWPTAPASISLDYRRYLPALTATGATNTNWLLEQHHDLYIFATLCEADAFGMNDSRLPLWEVKRDAIVADIIADSAERKYSRGPLVCRRMPERC